MHWLLSFTIFLSCISLNRSSDCNFNDLTGDQYVLLSQEFLSRLQNHQDVTDIVKKYATFDLNNLAKEVDTQEKKLTFWVNTYNAYIQYLLTEKPELYENRGSFFTKDRFTIAGQSTSFDRLEHGIIRNSRIKYGLGYFKKWFSPRYERKLRITKTDERVHFALNCGAITCPPIAIYNPEALNQQLDTMAHRYLTAHTTIQDDIVTTSPLFSWFRGDFGGKKGIVKFLKKYNIIPSANNVDLKFGDYDWTLSTGNYIEL